MNITTQQHRFTMKNKRVLVTGGAGFIGSHIVDAYRARGADVWVVDNFSTGKRSNLPDDIEIVEMDICDDALPDVFDRAGGFDVVSHHAAQMDVRYSVEHPRIDARTNVDGFLNVVECSVRHRVRRLLYVSSGGVVYGEPKQCPCDENATKAPMSPYGVTKITGERYLHYFGNVQGLEYATMRYGNVYGPRQDPHGEAGVVAIFSRLIHAGKPLAIYGDGNSTRDYVHVSDVVRANMLLTDAPLPAPESADDCAFNVGTGDEVTVHQIANGLMRAAGREVEVRHEAPRAGELRRVCLDTSRIRALGWSPQYSLSDGLKHTFEYITRGQEAPL